LNSVNRLRERGLTGRDAADRRDLLRHLRAGEDAALARLRPLAHLDFDRAHLRVLPDLDQPYPVHLALRRADAVLRGSDLEDHVRAAAEVVR
jgi:hypothetical protein